MNMRIKKNKSITTFIFFVLLIIFLNFIKYFLLNRNFNDVNLANEFIRSFISIFFWVIPALIYCKFFLKHPVLVYTRLNQNIFKNLGIGLLLSIFLSIIFVIIIKIKSINLLTYSLPPYLLFTVVIIYPFIEELIFRGIVLQYLDQKIKFIFANLLTSLLFLIPHFPQWIMRRYVFELLLSRSSLYIIIMSLIFGLVFKKSNSLYPGIILHSTYNYWALLLTLNY